MVNLVSFLLSLTITLSLSEENRSYDLFITKVEGPIADPEWFANPTLTLKKIGRNQRVASLNLTVVQDIEGYHLQCYIKIFQKQGGKYMKSPYDIPSSPCCNIFNPNMLGWRCVQEKSNLPKQCPITKGFFQIKDFNPEDCEGPKHIPPNMPEEYRIEFAISVGPKIVYKSVGYGVLKRRMILGYL